MPATATLKASDRQTIVKKLVTELRKRYRASLPKTQRPVLETLMFAACFEDAGYADAETAYQRMVSSFYDLNEIRVSSVNEIEHALGDLHEAAWKGMRIRETLQYTFENHFAFDLDPIRRKSQEAAIKDLSAIPYQTPFMRQYALQQCLAAHVIPVDERMKQALVWLGLADPEQTPEQISDDLKAAVKKSDGPLVFHLIKSLSVDPEFIDILGAKPDRSEGELDPFEAPRRLSALLSGKYKRARSAKAGKTAIRKKPKTSSGTARKSAGSKTSSKKVTKKKPAATAKRKTTKRTK